MGQERHLRAEATLVAGNEEVRSVLFVLRHSRASLRRVDAEFAADVNAAFFVGEELQDGC